MEVVKTKKKITLLLALVMMMVVGMVMTVQDCELDDCSKSGTLQTTIVVAWGEVDVIYYIDQFGNQICINDDSVSLEIRKHGQQVYSLLLATRVMPGNELSILHLAHTT